MTETRQPFVTIVMPALNEERYIAESILSILPRDGSLDYELLVMDGGSSDQTCKIVEALAVNNSRIRLVHNPLQLQSAAINLASSICNPGTEILVRADCHARYPTDYVLRLADSLRDKECASVVVSMHAMGRSPVQKAIAAAQNSKLGNGGSKHRAGGYSGYVDHGHHAAFNCAIYRSLGGYDVTAPFNEDAEFDERLRRAGGRIYLDGTLQIEYFPRSSWPSLIRQYRNHGWGRANTLVKHGTAPKARQIAPVLVLLMCLLALSTFPLTGHLALVPASLYVLACMSWGAVLGYRTKSPATLLSGLAAVTMHMSWAMGFLSRIGQHAVSRKARPAASTVLSSPT